MKKAIFYSLMFTGGKKQAVLQQGWTDGTYNYYKSQRGGTWYAVHPLYGLSVATGDTRSEAAIRAHDKSITEAIQNSSQTWRASLMSDFVKLRIEAKTA